MTLKNMVLVFATLTTVPSALLAEAGAFKDMWHQITPDSPIYNVTMEDHHGAGIVQSEGPDALFVLGQTADGAVVTIDLDGLDWTKGLISTLKTEHGETLDRRIDFEYLRISTHGSGTPQTVSFAVAPEDFENFMHAVVWTITDGTTTLQVSLKGTRQAISAALRDREASKQASTN